MKAHEREQAKHLGLVRHEPRQQRGQPLRVAGEVSSLAGVTGRCQVALVEDQVEDAQHLTQAGRQLRAVGHPVRDRRVTDLALGTNEALRDRGLGYEERARHRGGLEAADRPKRERDLGLPVQRRMAAREEEPQAVIGAHRPSGRDRCIHLGGLRGQLAHAFPVSRVAPQPVDRLAPRRGHEPCAGVVRDAVGRPVLERRHRRVLDQLLREVPVAEDPDERRRQPAALLAQDGTEPLVDVSSLRHARRLGESRASSRRRARTRPARGPRRDQAPPGSRSRPPSPCPPQTGRR